jgi:hypothetical protein
MPNPRPATPGPRTGAGAVHQDRRAGRTRILVKRPPAPPRYERARDLTRLVPLWPHEIADTSIAGRTRLVAVLRQALRHERQRGLAGHWAYDLARHHALLEAWRAEVAALVALGRTIAPTPPAARRPRSRP